MHSLWVGDGCAAGREEGCAAGWERVGQRLLLGRMLIGKIGRGGQRLRCWLGESRTTVVALLVGIEVDRRL